MGLTKHYFNDLLCQCAPENGFAQDAIAEAIVTGRVKLAGNAATDQAAVMAQYDDIVRDYQHALQSAAALTATYEPLLRQIAQRAA